MGGASYDQVLEEFTVTDLRLGPNRFVIQSDAPTASMIPANDLVGNTVITLLFEFGGRQLATLGYHVTTSYPECVAVMLENSPNLPHQPDQLRRQIHVGDPVLTRHWIDQQSTDDSDNDIEDLLNQASNFMTATTTSCDTFEDLDDIVDLGDIDKFNMSPLFNLTRLDPCYFNL